VRKSEKAKDCKTIKKLKLKLEKKQKGEKATKLLIVQCKSIMLVKRVITTIFKDGIVMKVNQRNTVPDVNSIMSNMSNSSNNKGFVNDIPSHDKYTRILRLENGSYFIIIITVIFEKDKR
ncbi:17052_t:CDS:2, partial [Funneliformis caledonium]